MTDDSLMVVGSPEDNADWNSIIEELIDITPDLPDEAVNAGLLLVNGHSLTEVAKKLKLPRKDVKAWLTKYPKLALAVNVGRSKLHKWRMAQMEKQFLDAVKTSSEILNQSTYDTDINSKVFATQAQHARWVIGLFLGQKVDIDVNINVNQGVLNASDGALDYIARRLEEQRNRGDVIEVPYTIVDANALGKRRPLLDEQGESPFSKIGEIETSDGRMICHICGKADSVPDKHVFDVHGLTNSEYEMMYMLPKDALNNFVKERTRMSDEQPD